MWRCVNRRQSAATCSRQFLARGILLNTLKMVAIRSPKRRFTHYLQGATSQKTAFFIVTAVKPQILHNFFCTSLHQRYLFLIFHNGNTFSTSYLYFQVHKFFYFMNFCTFSIITKWVLSAFHSMKSVFFCTEIHSFNFIMDYVPRDLAVPRDLSSI
jgi:hypothetical protein